MESNLIINQLWHGDCIALMKNIPDKSVDLITADLPYGTICAKWDEVIPFDKLWPEFRRICKNQSTVIIFGSQPFSSKAVMSNLAGYKHSWIWQKDKGANFAQVKRSPMKEHEDVLVFCPNESIKYSPIMEKRNGNGLNLIGTEYIPNFAPREDSAMGSHFGQGKKSIIKELRYPSSVKKFKRDVGLHPTQKPLALCEYLIKTYTNEGDLVFDPTMGCGTSCLAAKNTGRNYLGIESDEGYYKKAVIRLS